MAPARRGLEGSSVKKVIGEVERPWMALLKTLAVGVAIIVGLLVIASGIVGLVVR
jgi:hypothetical protein